MRIEKRRYGKKRYDTVKAKKSSYRSWRHGSAHARHHKKFLIAYVLYHESDITFFKRYGGDGFIMFRKGFPDKNILMAYKNLQSHDDEYRFRVIEIIFIISAKSKSHAKFLALKGDNYRFMPDEISDQNEWLESAAMHDLRRMRAGGGRLMSMVID